MLVENSLSESAVAVLRLEIKGDRVIGPALSAIGIERAPGHVGTEIAGSLLVFGDAERFHANRAVVVEKVGPPMGKIDGVVRGVRRRMRAHG